MASSFPNDWSNDICLTNSAKLDKRMTAVAAGPPPVGKEWRHSLAAAEEEASGVGDRYCVDAEMPVEVVYGAGLAEMLDAQ
jgi:hypothetical protein